ELFDGSPRDPAMRRRIGVTPQETGLPEALRVGELVDFVSAHFPQRVPKGELLDRFGLGDLVKRQIGGLSGGQKRRLAVALAFAGKPRRVVLDERTAGLDVERRPGVTWSACAGSRSTPPSCPSCPAWSPSSARAAGSIW